MCPSFKESSNILSYCHLIDLEKENEVEVVYSILIEMTNVALLIYFLYIACLCHFKRNNKSQKEKHTCRYEEEAYESFNTRLDTVRSLD